MSTSSLFVRRQTKIKCTPPVPSPYAYATSKNFLSVVSIQLCKLIVQAQWTSNIPVADYHRDRIRIREGVLKVRRPPSGRGNIPCLCELMEGLLSMCFMFNQLLCLCTQFVHQLFRIIGVGLSGRPLALKKVHWVRIELREGPQIQTNDLCPCVVQSLDLYKVQPERGRHAFSWPRAPTPVVLRGARNIASQPLG